MAANGWVCPGYRRLAHPSKRLTADHIVPASKGGRRLAVLCVSCNSRKRARMPDAPVVGPQYPNPL